ncbi:MAG: discoidin domain-containing protein, partial [Clostridia bacterium]|nr:discoidin domain-containing protein [Clostridia bacterium]
TEYNDETFDWIRVDLGTPKEVNRVALFPVFYSNLGRYYMFPKDYEIQLSADGVEWKTVAKVTDYTCETDKVVHDFDTETARYVRLYVTRVDKSVHDTPLWFVYLKEFEVSYIA